MDKVLVRNYTIGGFKRGEMAGTAMVPAYVDVLNSLTFRLLPKKRSTRERRVGLKIFVCVHWSFGRWFDDGGVCLSRARTKKH